MKKLFTCLMLMVGMLLPLTATAADLKADLTIYYDVSDFGDFSGNKLQLMVGHDSYSIAYEMKAVEGYDNLYSVNIGDVNSGNSWGGANQLGIMAATSVWGSENSSPTHRFSYTSLKTGIYKLTKNLSGNVLFTGKSTLSITENYTLPVKDPVINVGTLSQFPATTVNETSTATLTYKVENSDETAKVTVEGEGFTAEDVAGTITITFAPTEAKEYTATLTIAIGDIKETVDLVATGVAADAPKVPEILNLAAGEIAEIFAGETTEFEVTYTLLNAEEATASIEGEGFTIKKQEVGTATIEFAPTEAKTYEAVVTVTSGETIKTLEISATAKNAPTKITITYVNTEGYENVYIHAWGGTASATAWPGQQLTATGNQINGYDTYSFTFEEGAYVSCLFNCGVNPDACKTGDQTIDASKTYFSKGTWYATAEEIPAEVPDVWTVVGAEGLFETAWDFGNVAYDMTEGEGGIYTLVIDEVALDATDYTYKFVQNRSWSGAQYPKEGNYTLTVAEAASYKVTYTLDTNAGNGTCTIEKVTSPEPDPEPEPIDPYVAIRGTMTDWTMANDIKMTYNADAANGPEWYITAFEVPEEGQFKVVSVDDKSQTTWYGSDKVDLQEGITNANADQGDADIALPAGKYDIYFKVNEGRIWIQKYVAPEEPKPSLNVSAEEVVFDELTLGDEPVSATATITYTIENSDEAAVVALESEVFEAIDEDGTITITFAPEAEGEYTAELTITLGEIVKTIAISGSAKAAVVPDPELEFALVGRLNGDNDTEILDYASGYKFTKESEFVYTLNVTFTGTIESSGKQVQKVKLVDAQGNIWARNNSKTIYIQGTEGKDVTATMTKGETTSSAYLVTEAGVEYKITYTLNDEKTGGQLTFEKVEVIEPEKPELIVSTEEVVFETLILDGEQFSSTETITYEIKNSDEAAVIALESDVFKAEDEDGTITITFTPIFNNYLYKAELTITLGDIVKTVAISAVVKPLIDDILLPEFDDTKVGEYDEIEVLYSLHKGNEGEARIDGDEAFEITSQEVGRMFIKFTPLEVREYTATLIITSGKFEREITLIANGIAPDPEPTDITFTVQVPEGTKECYIAGTPGWTFIQMEKVDGEENLFSITVEKTVLNGEQWKYASGANWQYAEVIEGNGNRTEAEDPYDVVTAWQKLYDPDFQPIDPYYAIRGLNGDASWTGSGDIKLEESADASEWVALGFTVAEGESFKVIYIDENAKVSGYYAGLEDGCDVGQSYDDMGNLVLPAGTYNLYFKPDTELMWISKVDTPTDAEEAIAELIYAVDGTIYAPAPFVIIDLAGKDVTKANGSLQGTYIVKTLNSTAKISVK